MKNQLCDRFRDTAPKTGAEIIPSKEDFGHVRENPPSATTQKGAQLTENTVNTGQNKCKNNFNFELYSRKFTLFYRKNLLLLLWNEPH